MSFSVDDPVFFISIPPKCRFKDILLAEFIPGKFLNDISERKYIHTVADAQYLVDLGRYKDYAFAAILRQRSGFNVDIVLRAQIQTICWLIQNKQLRIFRGDRPANDDFLYISAA